MAKTDLVMLKCYVNQEQAEKIAAHAEEIGMGVSTMLRVLVIREIRNYERNAAPAIVSVETLT